MDFSTKRWVFFLSILAWVSWFLFVIFYGTWGGSFDFGKLGDSFGVYNALIGTLTLIFLGATYFHQKETLDKQTQEIRNQNFRNTMQSMFSELQNILNNISTIATGNQNTKGLLCGKDAFLGLDTGSVGYMNVNKENWLKKGGRENIENIILIIKQLEDFIDASELDDKKKDFYLKLLKSYLGLSEKRVIEEILKTMNTYLKIFL